MGCTRLTRLPLLAPQFFDTLGVDLNVFNPFQRMRKRLAFLIILVIAVVGAVIALFFTVIEKPEDDPDERL